MTFTEKMHLGYSLGSKVRMGKSLHPKSLFINALGGGQGDGQNTEVTAWKPESSVAVQIEGHGQSRY